MSKRRLSRFIIDSCPWNESEASSRVSFSVVDTDTGMESTRVVGAASKAMATIEDDVEDGRVGSASACAPTRKGRRDA